MNIKKIYTLNYIQRIVNAAGGILIILIVSNFYDLLQADEFYAVFSLLGLIAFYEFGYAILVVQRFSFHSNNINSKRNQLILDAGHYLSIISIFSIVLVATFPIVALYLLGKDYTTFSVFLALLLALNLKYSMTLNVVEGLGLMEFVAEARVAQALLSYSAMLLALCFGFGYYAVALLPLVQLLIAMAYSQKIYKNSIGFNIIKHNFINVFDYSLIRKEKFFEDSKYSAQLYLTALSVIFGNQVWIIFLNLIGVANISKYAITLQIITACSGFALTPIASRLAQLAKINYEDDDKLKNQLIKAIVRDIFIASIISIFGVVFLYAIIHSYSPGRTLEITPTLVMMSCIPMIIFVSVVGILIQSKGKGDMVFVSLCRILIPVIMFSLFISSEDSQKSISLYYLLFNVISMCIAFIYLIKEAK